MVYPPTGAWEWWTVGVGWLAAALLLPGAVMIAMRMTAGRILIVIGCGVVITYSIFSIVTDLNTRSRPVHNALPLPFELAVVTVVLAAVTVAFAVAPSTRRWLESAQPRQGSSDAADG